jgi:DNA-binding CsgD family transcriptional regulator
VAAAVDQIAWDGGVSVRRVFGVGLAVISMAEMGRHDEAAQLQATLDRAFSGRACWVLSRLAAWSRAVMGGLASEQGSANEALRVVVEDATANQYWSWARWMVADLAESAAYGQDHGLAKRAHDLLMSDPWRPAGLSHEGLGAFVAGAAAVASGDAEAAAPLFENAVDKFSAAGWRLFEGRALALLGLSLARVDRARALDAFERSAARFQHCQATVRRERVLTAIAGLGARGRRKKTELIGPGALSARERQVAQLAAKGYVAREIADQLFIGERTVETHLANVYAKLGVASKLDLMRRAGELGI